MSIAIKIGINFGHLTTMFISSIVAIWFTDLSHYVVPAICFVATALLMLQELIDKTGLEENFKKYRKLTRKAMDLEREMDQEIHSLICEKEFEEKYYMELMECHQSHEHDLRHYGLDLDKQVDAAIKFFDNKNEKSAEKCWISTISLHDPCSSIIIQLSLLFVYVPF